MAQVLKTDQIARAHVLMHLNTWDKGFSDRLDQLFAAHREAERERCAVIADEHRAILEQGPPVLLGWSVTQAKIRLLKMLSAAIRKSLPGEVA
jgi:hypothetical protein